MRMTMMRKLGFSHPKTSILCEKFFLAIICNFVLLKVDGTFILRWPESSTKHWSFPGVDYLKISIEDSPYARIDQYFDIVADRIKSVKVISDSEVLFGKKN